MLYTDNWYTLMKLAKLLYEKYGWTLVGTIVPTYKKSRENYGILFLKLPSCPLRDTKRGWYHEAVIGMKTRSETKYYIQSTTTWKDKKQVCFLSSNRYLAQSHGSIGLCNTFQIGTTQKVLNSLQPFGRTYTTYESFVGVWIG